MTSTDVAWQKMIFASQRQERLCQGLYYTSNISWPRSPYNLRLITDQSALKHRKELVRIWAWQTHRWLISGDGCDSLTRISVWSGPARSALLELVDKQITTGKFVIITSARKKEKASAGVTGQIFASRLANEKPRHNQLISIQKKRFFHGYYNCAFRPPDPNI